MEDTSRRLLASFTGKQLSERSNEVINPSVEMRLLENELIFEQRKFEYSEIRNLATFASRSTWGIIFSEWSASIKFITNNNECIYLLDTCQWTKKPNIKNIENASAVLCHNTRARRLSSMVATIKEHGRVCLPLESWAVLGDGASLDDWSESRNHSFPTKERLIYLTGDGYLERGDGFKVHIPTAFSKGQLFIGTHQTGYGALDYSFYSPDKIVAANEPIKKGTKNKISFTLTYDKDVVQLLLLKIAKG